MFNLVCESLAWAIRRTSRNILIAYASWAGQSATAAQADWFPDPPLLRHFAWSHQPCLDCQAYEAPPAWLRMAELAGVRSIRFFHSLDESLGPAYSAAPDVIVLTPAALQLQTCELAFVIGHEIVHIAQRHFDEDAVAFSVYSGRRGDWTDSGEAALQLTEGDFGLALRLSHLWQAQEQEADWMGALLAAQGCGCSIESGALPYLGHDAEAGGGLAAAHAPSLERVRRLMPFTESARRLVDLGLR